MSESQSMVDGLRSDHQAISAALADPATSSDERAREQTVTDLVRHFVAEEQYLYPALREYLADGAEIADSSFLRDRACEQLLRWLESELDADELVSVWQQIAASFAEHVRSQEGPFKVLEETVDSATLAELGADIRGAEQLAPTRPRTIASESPTLNKVTSLIEGFVDHVRDTYSHRGR